MADKDMELQHVEVEEHGAVHSTKANDEADASLALAQERNMSLTEAIRSNKKAILWSILVSTSVIMEGYDIVLVTSLFAQPAFAKDFGSYSAENGGWQVSGAWQSALGTAPQVGAIFGAFINGYLVHKFGYRYVLIGSLIAITAFVFPLFFADTSLVVLEVGLLLCGIPWGVFATLAPAYASEVCPMSLRGYLTVYVNLCWALGQLIAAGVLERFVTRQDQWAYRIPFAIQWVWPVPLAIILWFTPESPWWLIRRGKLAAADQSLRRLLSGSTPTSRKQAIAHMAHTNETEIEMETGTSYWDCFKKHDLRRTEIACVAFAAQIWCGTPLGGTPVYFFVQAGVSTSNSFKFSVGGLGLACIGTLLSWTLLSRFGRRSLYVVGLGALALSMLIVGIISAAAGQGMASSYAQAGFILLWLLIYYTTVGPVCYAIISEVSATRLRNKSVCISRVAYYVMQIVGNVIQPYMINPTEANWHGKTGFFWAGTCALCFLWAFYRLPETKDRTFEELDLLFAQRLDAREFSKTKVDAFAEQPK